MPKLSKSKFKKLVKVIKDDLKGKHKHEYGSVYGERSHCIWCGEVMEKMR